MIGARRRAPEEREEDRALALGCVAALVGFLVAGFFEYNFGDTEVLLVAASLMAVPFVFERERRKASGAPRNLDMIGPGS